MLFNFFEVVYHRNMLKVENLNFGYIKSGLCIKDLSFELKNGECLGVLGGEGMGKTALLKVIAGLNEQYYGNIFLDNKNIKDILPNKRSISLILDEPVLFENKTIRYNLGYLFEVENRQIPSDEILEKELKDFDLLMGLDAKINKLSKADKLILCLLRAKLKNANVVLIDDLFSGQSDADAPRIKNAISMLINRKNTSKTTILVQNNAKHDFLCSKYLYLSFTKNYFLESLNFAPIDLFSLEYLHKNSKDFILKREGDEFFIYSFLEETKKKKTTINLLEKYKLSNDFFERLKKSTCIDSGESLRVVLSFDGEPKLNDRIINERLQKGECSLFEKFTGEKLL